MMKTKVILTGTILLALCARASQAVEVNITVTGVVESNLIGGSHAGVMPNDPVIMSFNVDSNNFVNSPKLSHARISARPQFFLDDRGR